jgi:hypothetical protein
MMSREEATRLQGFAWLARSAWLASRGLTTIEEVGRVLPIRSEAQDVPRPPARPAGPQGEEPKATGAEPDRGKETILNP